MRCHLKSPCSFVACDELNLTFIKCQCTSVATRAQLSDWKHQVPQEAAFQQDRAQAWSQISSAQHHLCGFSWKRSVTRSSIVQKKNFNEPCPLTCSPLVTRRTSSACRQTLMLMDAFSTMEPWQRNTPIETGGTSAYEFRSYLELSHINFNADLRNNVANNEHTFVEWFFFMADGSVNTTETTRATTSPKMPCNIF